MFYLYDVKETINVVDMINQVAFCGPVDEEL